MSAWSEVSQLIDSWLKGGGAGAGFTPEERARVLWQMFWIDLVARCCKSGMRALSCLAERVGSLLRCFLMALRVAWRTVDFLPVPIFSPLQGRLRVVPRGVDAGDPGERWQCHQIQAKGPYMWFLLFSIWNRIKNKDLNVFLIDLSYSIAGTV